MDHPYNLVYNTGAEPHSYQILTTYLTHSY